MNAPEERAAELGYQRLFEANERVMRMIFGYSASLMSYDTLQFSDYAEVVATRFDAAAKKKRRQEIFPQDGQKAFELGGDLMRV